MNASAPNERWLPVPGYEGLYEVSNEGRVRSLYWQPPRILALCADQSGYPVAHFNRAGTRKAYTVHRLVCRAFHGEPDSERNEAAHLDGDRSNARADNLRWVTKLENHSHKRLHGTSQTGEKHPRSRLSEGEVRTIKAARGHERCADLAARFRISTHTVSDIWRGKRWKHL